MGRGYARLWKVVHQLLRRREGRRFQVLSIPGTPARRCFGSERDPVLTVSVAWWATAIYVAPTDTELATSDQLLAWLIDGRPEAVLQQRSRAVDELKRSPFFRWE
ncbi:MAG: hypothetical protein ACRDYZ_03030 [Acidimicrobiales bacterium]